MNPQPSDLESGALPLELLALLFEKTKSKTPLAPRNKKQKTHRHQAFVSLCGVCFLQCLQYLRISSLSGVFFLFFIVE